MQPESHARDGGEVHLIVQGRGDLEETPHFVNTEDGGEAVCGFSPKKRQGVPGALQNVLVEEPDTTGADAHGSGGEPIDICAVQEGVLKLGFGEQVG